MFEISIPLDAVPSGPRSAAGRIEQIVALERQIARLQAEQAELVAAHAARTVPGAERGIAAEVALARGVSVAAAEHQLAAAQVLATELPELFELLHRGEVSWAGVRAVIRETTGVQVAVRREIDRRLAAAVEQTAAESRPIGTPGAPLDPTLDPGGWPAPPPDDEPPPGAVVSRPATLVEVVHGRCRLTVLPDERPRGATVARLAAAARRLVLLLDAQAAAARAEHARADRHVQLLPPADPRDGTGTLLAVLPAEHAAACWHALDSHARGRRADGDDRSIAQLMADTLTERLTGRTGRAGPTGPALPPAQIGVLIRASTLLGSDDSPASLRGHGLLPATVARALCGAPGSRLRRVIVDDTGHVLTVDRSTRHGRPAGAGELHRWLHQPADWTLAHATNRERFFTGPLRALIGWRDATCRMPVCDSRITDIDHVAPHASGGPTTAANGQGLSVRCHHLRDLPGWHVGGTATSSTWTTPTGHRYTSRPPPALGWASEPP